MDLTGKNTREDSSTENSAGAQILPLLSTFCQVSIVFLCVYSWWGPALTSSAWCPSWCLSSSLSWSSFFPFSSNFSRKCCPPPSSQSPKRHVLFAHTDTEVHTRCRLSDPATGFSAAKGCRSCRKAAFKLLFLNFIFILLHSCLNSTFIYLNVQLQQCCQWNGNSSVILRCPCK